MGLLRCGLCNPMKLLMVRHDCLGLNRRVCLPLHSFTSRHGIRYSSSAVRPVFLSLLEDNDFLGSKTLLIDNVGSHSYFQILEQSFHLYLRLKKDFNIRKGARVAYLCPNNISYTIVQWAAWMAGCIAVPLCSSHPPAQLKYYIQNSTPAVVIGTNDFYDSLQPLCDAENLRSIWLQFNPLTRTYVQSGRNFIPENRSFFSALYRAYSLSWKQTDWEKHDALLIYTSGTTDQPKGVLMTHGNIHAQIQNMTEAWQWSEDDVLLHVLPLHHVHGVTNCLATCLNSAATCVMLPRFDAQQVWEKLTSEQSPVINLFMAVPTIYAKLIEYYNHNYKSPRVQEFIRSVCKENIRLMVSGSAALPTPIMEKWEEITGHVLLERYGMTEIGMALTNPLHGERVAGAVGNPFPSVKLRIVEKDGTVVAQGDGMNGTITTNEMEESEGELHVKGPSVFHKYWRKPQATKEEFTEDGWFKTGDTVAYRDGRYHIIGRTSVDIIKSGGYKISALEIERHLLANQKIKECVVFGIPDPTWGENIVALVVLNDGYNLTLLELKQWAADILPSYKLPSVLKCVENIPKNPMGKVNKKQLKRDMFSDKLNVGL